MAAKATLDVGSLSFGATSKKTVQSEQLVIGVLLGFAMERLGKGLFSECGKNSLQFSPGSNNSFPGCGLKS